MTTAATRLATSRSRRNVGALRTEVNARQGLFPQAFQLLSVFFEIFLGTIGHPTRRLIRTAASD
jgi:hypothetical protein